MGWLRRRRVRVILAGVLLVVGVGTWWALPQIWSPPRAPGIGALGTDSPFDNLTASPEASSRSGPSTGETSSDAEDQAMGLGLVQERGRLVLTIDGERMGEEVYQISRRPDGGVELASRGRFSLKVWFATVSFDYTQQIQMDQNLDPQRYRLDLDGPLGVGSRHIRADVSGGEARIRMGKAPQTVSVPDGPLAFIGVLASYAFTPKLMDDREQQSLTAVVFDVRDPDPSSNASVPAVPLEVTRQGTARLESVERDQSIETARYRLSLRNEPESQLTMYTQSGTFIGLEGRFSPDEPPFRIYRADRLPGGFTVESEH